MGYTGQNSGRPVIVMPESAAISVVIPCFNHANVLRRTLECLVHQTLQPREVVVIDDGSTDNPEPIVREFKDRLPLAFTRLRHNHGAPFARNEGAKLTSSPYLLFLDADAELVSSALQVFAETLHDHPESAFAYSNFLWGAKRFRGQVFNVEELKKRNYIHTSSLIRREAFTGFDETLKKFQDWDLWLTMAKHGATGVWIDRDLYRIQPRRQGMSRWLPRIAYWIPWQKLGYEPKEITYYRDAEAIVKKKHSL